MMAGLARDLSLRNQTNWGERATPGQIARLQTDADVIRLLPHAYPYPPPPGEMRAIIDHLGGTGSVIHLLEQHHYQISRSTANSLRKDRCPTPHRKTVAYLRLLRHLHPRPVQPKRARARGNHEGALDALDACVVPLADGHGAWYPDE